MLYDLYVMREKQIEGEKFVLKRINQTKIDENERFLFVLNEEGKMTEFTLRKFHFCEDKELNQNQR